MCNVFATFSRRRNRSNRKHPYRLTKKRKWLPFVDTYRTFCLAPGPEAKDLLLGVKKLTHALAPGHSAGINLPAHLEGNSGEVDFPGPAFSVGIPECPLVLALPLVGNTRVTSQWERHQERLIRDGDLQGMGRFFGRPPGCRSLPWAKEP